MGKNNIFYYFTINNCRMPHECYFTEQQAYDMAIDQLKVAHGYDLYFEYEDDIKIHKIKLHD